MKKQPKITKTMQKVAADILTQFMFTKNMDNVMKVWHEVYKQYDLNDDPFTGCPCTNEEWADNNVKLQRQILMERYGHCDALD